MGKLFTASLLLLSSLAFFQSAHAQVFYYGYGYGYASYGPVMPRYSPPATYDSRIAPSLVRAATIADERAGAHSKLRCWHYVKEALMDAGAVQSVPTTAYACQAGGELVSRHGFVQLRTRDPYAAPIGSVIVYAGRGAGHVEMRTSHGFASDYRSIHACSHPYRVIGIYAKLI